MTREEIEQGFVDAGWELDGGFSGYLIIGEDKHLSTFYNSASVVVGDRRSCVRAFRWPERTHLLGSGDTDASASRGAARRAWRAA